MAQNYDSGRQMFGAHLVVNEQRFKKQTSFNEKGEEKPAFPGRTLLSGPREGAEGGVNGGATQTG